MRGRGSLLAPALAMVLALAGAAEARGDDQRRVIAGAGEQRTPPDHVSPPPGWRSSARAVIALAGEQPEVRRVLSTHPRAYPRAYLKARRHWQVSWFSPPSAPDDRTREIAQVLIRDRDAQVVEAWTGLRVDWPMARGYPGAFGRALNTPWIWLGLCAAFLLPFLRPPLRLLHLDLAVLLSFSVSYALFTAGAIEASVPAAVPPLLYLLARTLAIARVRASPVARSARTPLEPALPAGGLALGAIALLAFRMVLNATDSTVIDVGYAGVIGADRLLGGHGLYGTFPLENAHGDTYGPVAYYAYVPWELLAPWSGRWDALPAAHAAAAAFDVAAAATCWALGRRFGGRRHGLLLAYLWLAFPFTLLTLNTNANDALTSALVGLTLLTLGRPLQRGAALALAGLVKFAPLALGPLVAVHPRAPAPGTAVDGVHRLDRRDAATTCAAFLVVAALLLAPVLVLDGAAVVVERTLGFQVGRSSPFSPWGLYDLGAGRWVAVGAAVALAGAVAFVPRRRDAVSACALAAGVLIAVQLALGHWFYTYLVWFLPPLWVALLAPYGHDGSQVAAGRSTDSMESARRGRSARMRTALSHGSASEGS